MVLYVQLENQVPGEEERKTWGIMHIYEGGCSHGFQKRIGKLDIINSDQGSDSCCHRFKYIHLEKRILTTALGNIETIHDLGQNNFTGVVETTPGCSELKRARE